MVINIVRLHFEICVLILCLETETVVFQTTLQKLHGFCELTDVRLQHPFQRKEVNDCSHLMGKIKFIIIYNYLHV